MSNASHELAILAHRVLDMLERGPQDHHSLILGNVEWFILTNNAKTHHLLAMRGYNVQRNEPLYRFDLLTPEAAQRLASTAEPAEKQSPPVNG